MDRHPGPRQWSNHFQRAYRLITSEEGRQVFDLASEDPRTRGQYGHTQFGQSCLLARRLAEAEVPYDRIRELERKGASDRMLWKAVLEQGWLGLPFSEALGGGGGSLVDVGLLVEEFSRRAAITPILEVLAVGRVLDRLHRLPLRHGWLLLVPERQH